MSLVGPRPALWNQEDLIRAGDRYGANGVPVGLTCWAQVNGRELLSIEKKARLDGDLATYYADVRKAKNELNWTARRTIRQVCADAWRFERRQFS